ncbi:unnamed protein product [Rhizoctonia solani]|uniref:Uncharacterized protein n=1 Tax=Rhizoctonia solani TaxID=456999 RepID=A0A8H3A0I3_9AGAM|nr:unnamed protein product [Rhizoctonia solani]CAE6390728.1 unnamed protein product [Rhizoctonia solani]
MALQQLDPNSMVLALTTLSFVTSPFQSPRYNLPINLFGIYALDKTESNEPLRLFTAMEGISVFLDIVYMWRNEQNGFIKFLTIVLTLGKIPTFLVLLQTLKARGDQFAHSIGGAAGFQSQTVWSMPGGFRQSGYDPVGEDLEGAAPPPPSNTNSANPSHHHQPVSQGQATQAGVPGGYQAS